MEKVSNLYSDWVSQDALSMMREDPDQILAIVQSLPWGQKELDEEKQQKLSEVHTLSVTSSIICDINRDKNQAAKFNNISKQIFSLIPDDTHTQTYMLGQLSILSVFKEYVDEIQPVEVQC